MGKVNGFSFLKSLVECMILSGPFLVSRTGDEGWTWCKVKVLNNTLIRYHKGCWFIWTAGRWSWKSKSAKECVTTHLPNQVALKMDGAQANYRYSAICAFVMHRWVGGRDGGAEGAAVTSTWTTISADLGVSSKYSNENFEDRSGERFHVKFNATWVTQS